MPSSESLTTEKPQFLEFLDISKQTSDIRRKFERTFECRQPSDIKVCSSSKNLSTKKPNQYLESLDISKPTSDIFKNFWKNLNGGNSVKISDSQAFSHIVLKYSYCVF